MVTIGLSVFAMVPKLNTVFCGVALMLTEALWVKKCLFRLVFEVLTKEEVYDEDCLAPAGALCIMMMHHTIVL